MHDLQEFVILNILAGGEERGDGFLKFCEITGTFAAKSLQESLERNSM